MVLSRGESPSKVNPQKTPPSQNNQVSRFLCRSPRPLPSQGEGTRPAIFFAHETAPRRLQATQAHDAWSQVVSLDSFFFGQCGYVYACSFFGRFCLVWLYASLLFMSLWLCFRLTFCPFLLLSFCRFWLGRFGPRFEQGEVMEGCRQSHHAMRGGSSRCRLRLSCQIELTHSPLLSQS